MSTATRSEVTIAPQLVEWNLQRPGQRDERPERWQIEVLLVGANLPTRHAASEPDAPLGQLLLGHLGPKPEAPELDAERRAHAARGTRDVSRACASVRRADQGSGRHNHDICRLL